MLAMLFIFNKRLNSLKFPNNSETVITGDVKLKAPTSLHTPTLLFACGETDMPLAMQCNYCSFNNHYYWITDTRMMNNTHIEFDCRIDVLASYRNEILNTNAYIERSSSDFNLNLPDSMCVPTIDMNYNSAQAVLGNYFDIYGENYILQVNGISGVQLFMLNESEMSHMLDVISDKNLTNSIVNPFSYIIKMFKVPVRKNAFREGNSPGYIDNSIITFGGYTLDTTVTGTAIVNWKRTLEFDITVPHRYSDFRGSSPYTEYLLTLPYIGVVQLDSTVLCKSPGIYILLSIDFSTGDIIYRIDVNIPNSTEALYTLATYSGNCYSEYAVATSFRDTTKYVSSIVQGAGSALAIGAITKNPVSILGSTGYVMDGYFQSLRPNSMINGSISSNLGRMSIPSIILSEITHKQSETPNNLNEICGNAACKMATIRELSGYVQTKSFSLSATAHNEEIREVNQLMDGGVYIE